MSFQKLQNSVKNGEKKSLAVAWAADPSVLEACIDAKNLGLLQDVYLTGREKDITETAATHQLDISQLRIVEEDNPKAAAASAVALVRQGKAGILMKGLLGTSILLKAVLDREIGLRTEKLLSHIGILEFPDSRLVLLTDGGMNIRPTLEEKIQIVDNAIHFAYDLGIHIPKVAILAAIEAVNPKMPETLDAAALVQMSKRGQFKRAAIIDGPLAFDNVVSAEAAAHKGLVSEVVGNTDILVVPEIVAGNVLYKSLTYIGHLKGAGVIYGAACPIVLTSRADTRESKVNSLVVACKAAQA